MSKYVNQIRSRNFSLKVLLFILATLFLGNTAIAAIIKVPNDHPSIQSAINAAKSGDVIWVKEGTYTENITFKEENVTVVGSWNSDFSGRDWNNSPSIIDGGGNGSVVIGVHKTTLDGFTIRNGNAQFGGGIFVEEAAMNIWNCRIENNSAQKGGGGIYIKTIPSASPFPRIDNNTISSNQVTAGSGGGIYLESGAMAIKNNTIENNSATRGGGGISIMSAPSLPYTDIENNTISSNETGGKGGGISIRESDRGIRITNNVIARNEAHSGGGISLRDTPLFRIEDNEIHNNKADKSGVRRSGGGILIIRGSRNAEVIKNRITGNIAADRGAGIFLQGGTFIGRNFIQDNITTGEPSGGGGLWLTTPDGVTAPKLVNNFIAGNKAKGFGGGGIYIEEGTDHHIINNTIAHNEAPVQKGGGMYVAFNASCVIKNTILWDNGDNLHLVAPAESYVTYNDIEDGPGAGAGNISEDPLFNSDGLHITKGSPCIDAGHSGGAPSVDYDGDGRDSKPDIGADEFVPGPWSCPVVRAAEASYLESHIDAIRDFRDEHLVTNSSGRSFVELYYQFSPSIVTHLDKHEHLRTLTRWGLTPVVYSIEYPRTALAIGLVLIFLITSLSYTRIRRNIDKRS
ncbi:MAG: hypothetical protein BA864_13310 [Desulfuromonadales bacterium C00003093]|nr:MAG: hypothetical protein BA864_13310 [Desulfuromonadales bacterium C00003093]